MNLWKGYNNVETILNLHYISVRQTWLQQEKNCSTFYLQLRTRIVHQFIDHIVKPV